MPTYRLEVISSVREYYLVEAEDEDAASTMVIHGQLDPVMSEPVPETTVIEVVEKV